MINSKNAITSGTISNLPLYISALALLIAVLIALFFYKQFRQVKQEIQKLSGLKNQINTLDDKINYVQESFTKTLSAAGRCESPEGSAKHTQTVHEEESFPDGCEATPLRGAELTARVKPTESPEFVPDDEKSVENAETDDEDTEIIARK